MLAISVQDVAIACALREGHLRLRVFATRNMPEVGIESEWWVAIEDRCGVIEVAPPEEAVVRVRMARRQLQSLIPHAFLTSA